MRALFFLPPRLLRLDPDEPEPAELADASEARRRAAAAFCFLGGIYAVNCSWPLIRAAAGLCRCRRCSGPP